MTSYQLLRPFPRRLINILTKTVSKFLIESFYILTIHINSDKHNINYTLVLLISYHKEIKRKRQYHK